jgi:single-stranded DNA-binding protein
MAVAVTAEQLLSELEANALAAKNTWNDKKVVITGTLDNIDASGKYFSLRGDAEITFINVQIYIDDSFTSVVSSFKKGQSVTVTGEITDVGELLGYSVKAISIP